MTAKRFILKSDYDWWYVKDTTGQIKGEYDDWFSDKEVVEYLNNLHEEKEEMQKKMNRLYNYFEDFFSEEMGNDDFAEQWEFVADDEKWD